MNRILKIQDHCQHLCTEDLYSEDLDLDLDQRDILPKDEHSLENPEALLRSEDLFSDDLVPEQNDLPIKESFFRSADLDIEQKDLPILGSYWTTLKLQEHVLSMV